MHNSIFMKVFNSIDDLDEIFSCFVLTEWPCPQNLLIQVMKAVFHDQKYFVFTNMIAVGRQYVGMLTVKVNFHFLNEKLKFDLFSIERLQGNKYVINIGHCKDDLSCLTFTQLFYHLQFILGFLRIFQFCHFFKCFVHILQFIIDVQLFFKIFAIQPHWYFVRLKFFLDFIYVAGCIKISLENFFRYFGSIGFAVSGRVGSIFGAFRIPFHFHQFGEGWIFIGRTVTTLSWKLFAEFWLKGLCM